MEKYLVALLICVSSMVHAQPFETKLNVVCDKTETMFNRLKKEYGETISIYAEQPSEKTPDVLVSVWLSDEGETISVVETHVKHNISCLISVGKNVRYKVGELL